MPPRIPRPLAVLGLVFAVRCSLFAPHPVRMAHSDQPRAIHEDSPDAAAQYFAMKRGLTDGFNPHPLYDAARAQIERRSRLVAESATGPLVGSWTSLGPTNIAGRTRALLIDPINPQYMYAAAVSGGVLRSFDEGRSWTPTSDRMANLNVSSLAFDSADSLTIYAGTGEGYYREEIRGTSTEIRGDGIFVTHDGASTWAQIPSTAGDDFAFVNDLAVSPHDPQRIYAATRTGVWRSMTGGASWSNVLPVTVKGGCLDLALRTDTDHDYLLASCGTFEQATVYRSTSAESSGEWESVLTEPGMGRTSLSIAPSNPNIVYALAASIEPGDYDEGLLAVFRSDQGGAPGTWSARLRNTSSDRVSTALLSNPQAAMAPECDGSPREWVNMGWHDNTIAVEPNNPDFLFAGGVELFASTDGGRTWGTISSWVGNTNIGSAHSGWVHADLHAIVFGPRYNSGTRSMYLATDGGLFTSSFPFGLPPLPSDRTSGLCYGYAGTIYSPLNHGLTSLQFYHGTTSPKGDAYMGGAQDNGTNLGSDYGGPGAWQEIYGGDGGYVAIDPQLGASYYAESQWATIMRSSGGPPWRSGHDGLNDDFLFITPFLLDPNVITQLWTGGRYLWRSTDRAGTWTRVTSTPFEGQVSSLAVARGTSGHMAVGTTSGSVYRNDGSGTWSSARPRDGFVSSITYADADTLFATYAFFGGGPHLWRSTDAGATWTPLGLDLPDIPLHSFAIYGDRLFLGSDLGIWVSYDGGVTWANDPTFPTVITESITVNRSPKGFALFAFTHGRGAWRAELGSPGRRRAAGR